MIKIRTTIVFFFLIICINTQATYKVYFIHGIGGLGLEMGKIQQSVKKSGFTSEIYKYPSLLKDIDSVSKVLFEKIRTENYDTVSFVTHSMGGLVVRSIYGYINPDVKFPYIHRVVMIAPPNKGSPVADTLNQHNFFRFLLGPNISNLTTDSLTGSNKYPIPKCEIGLIIGQKSREKFYTIPLYGENDGLVLAESSKIGIEKDIAYVKARHVGLLFKRKVKKLVVSFLKDGKFETS